MERIDILTLNGRDIVLPGSSWTKPVNGYATGSREHLSQISAWHYLRLIYLFCQSPIIKTKQVKFPPLKQLKEVLKSNREKIMDRLIREEKREEALNYNLEKKAEGLDRKLYALERQRPSDLTEFWVQEAKIVYDSIFELYHYNALLRRFFLETGEQFLLKINGDNEALSKILNQELHQASLARDALILSGEEKVKRMVRKHVRNGYYEDIKQHAYFGMIEAADRYDYRLETSFLAFAEGRIKNVINDYFRYFHRLIRWPSKSEERIQKMERYRQKKLLLENSEPAAEEYAKRLGINQKEVEFLLNSRHFSFPLSLNQIRIDSEGNRATIWELIAYRNLTGARDELQYKKVERQRLKELLLQQMGGVSKRDQKIVWRRIGLEEELKEIGMDYELTKERIRQVQVKGMEALRQESEELEKLKEFL